MRSDVTEGQFPGDCRSYSNKEEELKQFSQSANGEKYLVATCNMGIKGASMAIIKNLISANSVLFKTLLLLYALQ